MGNDPKKKRDADEREEGDEDILTPLDDLDLAEEDEEDEGKFYDEDDDML